MTRMPDPWLVNLPSPLTASGKMQGHMTELNKPQLTMAHFATAPCPKIVISTIMAATMATAKRAVGPSP